MKKDDNIMLRDAPTQVILYMSKHKTTKMMDIFNDTGISYSQIFKIVHWMLANRIATRRKLVRSKELYMTRLGHEIAQHIQFIYDTLNKEHHAKEYVEDEDN